MAKFNVSLKLSEVDQMSKGNNVFGLIGEVTQALQQAGATEADIQQFQQETLRVATFQQLVAICRVWIDIK